MYSLLTLAAASYWICFPSLNLAPCIGSFQGVSRTWDVLCCSFSIFCLWGFASFAFLGAPFGSLAGWEWEGNGDRKRTRRKLGLFWVAGSWVIGHGKDKVFGVSLCEERTTRTWNGGA